MSVAKQQPKFKIEQCIACGGKGKSTLLDAQASINSYTKGGCPIRKGHICQACAGRGSIAMQIDAKPCSTCLGKGRRANATGRDEPCIDCQGSGINVEHIIRNPELDKSDLVELPCQACKSRGCKKMNPTTPHVSQEEGKCDACNATGVILAHKAKVSCGFCDHTGILSTSHNQEVCHICRGCGWAFHAIKH